MHESDLIEWAGREAERLRALGDTTEPPDAHKSTVQARQFLSDFAAGSAFQEAADDAVASCRDPRDCRRD